MSQALMEEAKPISDASQKRCVPTEHFCEASLIEPCWLPPLVLIAALGIGISVYAWFWQHSLDVWWSMGHDRHTHYMFGLNLAMDVRTGDLMRLFHDFDRMRVWGPLHPVLVALVELVGGPDHRLAVLPSLAGWIMTMWFAFLIPRRLLPSGGNAAGLLAAFFVAVSPAHRAYATDVMYESLGAGLTLAAIYLYLVVLQEGMRRAAVLLGLALSALFLHKYTYWLFVVFGITFGEFARQPRAWLDFGLSLCRRDRLPSWALAELKQPLNWIALTLAGAAVTIAITGGGMVHLGRWNVSMQEPHNFVHAAYIAFFIRVAWWWRQTGRAWSLEWPGPLRTVLLWHGPVIALWFLLPKRLSYFVWYLGFANDQPRESVPFMHGLPYYHQGLTDDYLSLSWGLYLLGGMVVLALLAWRKLKPGAAALFFLLLLAIFLTCQHPVLKNRLMHTWIASAWILGSIGLVYAVQEIAGLLSTKARPWAAGCACVILISLQTPGLLEPGRAQEGGLKPTEPSPLRIPDTYLPALADAKNPTILSNVSARFIWTWTFIEYHHHQNMAAEIKNFKSYDGDPDAAKHWLATTRSDALVLIDIHPGTTYDWKTDEYVDLTAFQQALAEQTMWVQSQRWEMPEGVTITLWKKSG